MKLKIIDAKKMAQFLAGLIMCFVLAIASYSFFSYHFTNLPLTHKTAGYILRPVGSRGLYDYYFLNMNGDSIYYRGNFSGFSNRKYKYGDTVTILYNPLQMERTIPDNAFNKFFNDFSLIISIGVFIVFLRCLYTTYKTFRSAIEWY